MTRNSNRRWCLVALSVVGAIEFVTVVVAQVQTEHFESNVDSTVKPWTNLDFYNDPKNFKFIAQQAI